MQHCNSLFTVCVCVCAVLHLGTFRLLWLSSLLCNGPLRAETCWCGVISYGLLGVCRRHYVLLVTLTWGRSRCPRVIRCGVRPLFWWDCRLESRWGHGCLSFVSVVCCQVEVSATGRSLVQRISTDCGVSEFDQVQEYLSAPQWVGTQRHRGED